MSGSVHSGLAPSVPTAQADKPAAMSLTTATRDLVELQAALKAHLERAAKSEAGLRERIRQCRAVLALNADGIDHEKVAIAKQVVIVRGAYAKAGQDRAGVIFDATKQIATGEPIRPHYGDLWHVTFGTKNYDGWSGQRSDQGYGMGPRHGTTVFSVGLMPEVRAGAYSDLAPAQIEAAIYYLTNLERVQAAEAHAAEQSKAMGAAS